MPPLQYVCSTHSTQPQPSHPFMKNSKYSYSFGHRNKFDEKGAENVKWQRFPGWVAVLQSLCLTVMVATRWTNSQYKILGIVMRWHHFHLYDVWAILQPVPFRGRFIRLKLYSLIESPQSQKSTYYFKWWNYLSEWKILTVPRHQLTTVIVFLQAFFITSSCRSRCPSSFAWKKSFYRRTR